MAITPALSPFYYHDNFNLIVESVNRSYKSTFQSELAWLDIYNELNVNAQRLFVRLLTRTYSEYRVDTLNYAEIDSIDDALRELLSAQFITEGTQDTTVVCRLATKAELLSFVETEYQRTVKTKREAVDVLLHTEDVNVSTLSESIGIIENRLPREVSIVQLLFFGNTRQSLVDFVLRDLGVRRPPNWSVDSRLKFFESTSQIEAHLNLAEQSELFFDHRKHLEDDELSSYLVDSTAYDPLYQRRANKHNDRVARELERRGLFDEALNWFAESPTSFAWERQVRILAAKGDTEVAVQSFLNRGLETDTELDFARRFSKKLSRVSDTVSPLVETFEFPEKQMTLNRSCHRVETAVINRLAELGEQAFFAENQLINSLGVVSYWPVLTAEIPGAFINPFQFAPLDLFEDQFLARRTHVVNEVSELFQSSDWRTTLMSRWNLLSDFSISLWSPNVLPEDLLEDWLNRIDAARLDALLKHLFQDLRNRRAGQPDLVVRNTDGGWRFVEVKGPGDTLSDHQRRWLSTLNSLGFSAEVLWVSYADD